MTLVLAWAGAVWGQDWVIGAADPNEVVTQTTDRVVDGDLIIVNNGRLDVNGAKITLNGDLFVLNGGALNVTGGTIRLVQEYAYQRRVFAADQAVLRFTDAAVEPSGRSYGIGLAGTASADFLRVTVQNGFATWALLESATATLTDCTNAGEFVPLGLNSLTVSDSDTVLFWMTLPDGSAVDVSLPPPGNVAAWSMNSSSPWAGGIPYSVSLNNCTTVWWGVLAQSGCDGTFRDSTLRVVGSYFKRSNTVTITGVANNASIADTSYAWGDIALRFVNTSVQTWNYYSYGSTVLTLESCLFGELIVDETGEAWVLTSLCDGTGGYMGVGGNGTLWVWLSTNLSQTTSSASGTFLAANSALLGPAIDASDNSVLALYNTKYVGEPAAHDGGTIFDVAVAPVEAARGDVVSLRGTARVIAGPSSPHTFDSFSVDYGAGEEPTTWFPIAGPFDQEVRDATLATWDTCGVAPGAYAVRVSMLHGFPDPAAASSSVSMAQNGLNGDIDCDADVDLADFAEFHSCMSVPPNALTPPCDVLDSDADRDVDLHDLADFTVDFTGAG